MAMLPEVVVGLGCVPLAEYALPGTPALSESLLPFIPKYDALLMSNHGVVCYGENVMKAYFKMETVEHLPVLRGGRASGRAETAAPGGSG